MVDVFTPARLAGTFWANSNLLPREVTELARLGVPMDGLIGPPPIRAGYVLFDELGFEFDHHDRHGREGVRAFLFAITDPQGVCRDIVAWSPQLNRTATWLGRAWALGEERVYAPRLTDHGALPVWRDPLGWLRANRKGICLIRPKSAVHHLDDAGPLLAEDPEHGAELRRLLARPAPRILVPSLKTTKVA